MLKGLYFLHWIVFASLSKSAGPLSVGLFQKSLFSFINLCTCVSVRTPLSCLLQLYHKFKNQEMWLFQLCSFSKVLLWSAPFPFQTLLETSCIYKEACWYFERKYIKLTGLFGGTWHLSYVESSNPWTWYIFSFIFLWFLLLPFCSFYHSEPTYILLDLYLSILGNYFKYFCFQFPVVHC